LEVLIVFPATSFGYMYRAIFRLVFGMVCVYGCWCFGELQDLVLQIVVKIFLVYEPKRVAGNAIT